MPETALTVASKGSGRRDCIGQQRAWLPWLRSRSRVKGEMSFFQATPLQMGEKQQPVASCGGAS